ncbi:hypothetical protein ACFQX8_28985 [Klenkia terrae]|uniref:hypothetical protein n=1 Tax=Klenkia terrae TaxID=1052259 RepID=UPI0036200B91
MEGRAPADSNDAITALAAELSYTSDIHGSADYRRDITTTLFQRALRAAGRGPVRHDATSRARLSPGRGQRASLSAQRHGTPDAVGFPA